MQTGPTMRTRKSQKRYIKGDHGLGTKECPFCGIKEKNPREIYEETTHFYRVEAIFGYDIWDGHVVTDHQMIIPKRHITSLSAMNEEEGLEYLELVKNAEVNEYCIYSRGVDGPTKSVAHIHTHLIKLDNSGQIKRLFFLRKPHILLFRASKR
jgi:diadenosine tetraphosphate (Ap4A) HIT family hydrolase